MTFGFFARGTIDDEKNRAPKRLFEDGERVTGEEIRRREVIPVEGIITEAEYGPRKSLLRDFGWFYTVRDGGGDDHFFNEERIKKVLGVEQEH